MKWLDKIAKMLHIASGRKMVTYVGLIVSSIAGVCLQMGDEWLTVHLSSMMPRICGATIFLGGLIAAFGKGLADRRVDPEVPEIAPTERREPTIDG